MPDPKLAARAKAAGWEWYDNPKAPGRNLLMCFGRRCPTQRIEDGWWASGDEGGCCTDCMIALLGEVPDA